MRLGWPTAMDRIPGIFSVAQTGEILAVRAPREGKEWMRNNPSQDVQRWAMMNSTIAVLSASKESRERAILEQLDSLVQPTQFLEYLRKTMPMSDVQLDMITSRCFTKVARRR